MDANLPQLKDWLECLFPESGKIQPASRAAACHPLGAVEGVAEFPEEVSFEPLARVALSPHAWTTRRAAMIALVEMNPTRSLPVLASVMRNQEDEYEARMSAAQCLRRIENPSVVREMRSVLKGEPCRYMRYTLIMLLKDMGAWREKSR